MGTPQGEARELAAFEARGGPREGRPVLHVTTAGLVLVSERSGVAFDVSWGQMYTATRRGAEGIKLTWDAGGGRLMSYDLSFGDPGPVMHEMRVANEAWAARATFLESLGAPAAAGRADFGDNEDRWHATEAPAGVRVAVPPEAPAVSPRDPRVPQGVPDRHAWNDAWHDAQAGRFVTHSRLFCELEGAAGDEMYDSRLPDGSVALAQDDVAMVHGYPAVRRIWDGDGGSREAWTLLPTIRPEMLTVGMARGKVLPPGDAGAVTYLTDPAGIYAPKFCAPISVHEAVLLNSEMRKYAQSAYRGVIDRLNYLRENVKAAPGGAAAAGGAMRRHDAQDAHDDPNFRKWMLEPDA